MSARQWMVRVGLVIAACLVATPSAAQCQVDVSTYADGDYGEYNGNGEADLSYWGNGYDYSSCSPYVCLHEWDISVTVSLQPEQQVMAVVYGTYEAYSSVWVEPATYTIDVEFDVWCHCYNGWIASASAQQTIQVPPGPTVCVPPLSTGPNDHRYQFDNNPLWPGFWSSVHGARDAWNSFIWGFTSNKAFDFASAPTLTFQIDPGMMGTTDWAVAQIGGPAVRLNPDMFNHGAQFSDAVLLHELGHSRGYVHVSGACAVGDSILFPDWVPSASYPTDFGTGDYIAASRDN